LPNTSFFILCYDPLMRILLQKVTSASVSVDQEEIAHIDRGYLLFLGVIDGDTEENASWLAEKIVKLRLFDGDDGTINDAPLSAIDGSILVVSQFTLAGTLKKGNRPDFTGAAAPKEAEVIYEFFVETLRSLGVSRVETGHFGAMMDVALVNDGPVTLILER
jgi:D-aminoacyl-tRNA deacylase